MVESFFSSTDCWELLRTSWWVPHQKVSVISFQILVTMFGWVMLVEMHTLGENINEAFCQNHLRCSSEPQTYTFISTFQRSCQSYDQRHQLLVVQLRRDGQVRPSRGLRLHPQPYFLERSNLYRSLHGNGHVLGVHAPGTEIQMQLLMKKEKNLAREQGFSTLLFLNWRTTQGSIYLSKNSLKQTCIFNPNI